jgi:trimethyllysine dioxygenase
MGFEAGVGKWTMQIVGGDPNFPALFFCDLGSNEGTNAFNASQ